MLTPAEHAYAAYTAALAPSFPVPWDRLPLSLKRVWEAVAEAVLDAWQAQPRMETP